MVHCLRRVQFADRWQDTKGITREHDDVGGVPAHAGEFGIGDKLDWVGTSSVFRLFGTGIVDFARVLVEHDVFKNGTKLDGVKDFRFFFVRQINALCVASTFNVEHTVVGPAVLVVANQHTVGVGAQRSFTSAGKPKKERYFSFLALVCGRVQRQDTTLGHEVVHDGKDSLLHLTGVLGAKNNHFTASKVERHRGGRGHSGGVSVCREAARVKNGKVRLAKLGEFLGSGTNEHIVHEQSLVN